VTGVQTCALPIFVVPLDGETEFELEGLAVGLLRNNMLG
jgi:hypothetical protein